MRRLLPAVLILAALTLYWALDATDVGRGAARRDAAGGRERKPSEATVTPPSDRTPEDPAAARKPGAPTLPGSIYEVGNEAKGITVIAVDPNGKRLAGQRIVFRNREKRLVHEGVTGEQGIVGWEPPPRERIRIEWVRGEGFPDILVGNWRPRGRAVFQLDVYPVRTLRARITVDGRPLLPDGLRVSGFVSAGMTRDEASATVVARWLPRARETMLEARAPGLLPAWTTLEFDADRELHECALALHAPRSLVVRLQGDPAFAASVVLFRLGIDGEWATRGSLARGSSKTEADGLFRFDDLPPGEYRLRTLSGCELREFFLLQRSTTVDLDLRSAGLVEVVVDAPPPHDERRSLMFAVEAPGAPLPKLFPSGTRILHPGGPAIRVRVAVPGLRPHPVSGERPLRRPGGVVRLRAVAAPPVRFRWKRPEHAALPVVRIPDASLARIEQEFRLLSYARALRVVLREHGGTSLAYTDAHMPGERGLYEFVAPADGKFDLLVQEPGGATVLLGDVELNGETDLGTLQADAAHDVLVVARNRPRASFLDITAHEPESGFDIVSGRIHGDHGATILRGLPSGRIELRFRLGSAEWTRKIECAGGKSQTIEVDCRSR